jgi:hypothetical protein
VTIVQTFEMWHGSPTTGINDDFSNVRTPQRATFFTREKRVAEQYSKMRFHEALGAAKVPEGAEKKPTLYRVRVQGDFFDMRRPEHLALYEEIRQEHNAQDSRFILPPIDSEGFLHSHTHLPTWGWAGVFKPHLVQRGFQGVWLDEGSQGISLGIFDPSCCVRVIERFFPVWTQYRYW